MNVYSAISIVICLLIVLETILAVDPTDSGPQVETQQEEGETEALKRITIRGCFGKADTCDSQPNTKDSLFWYYDEETGTCLAYCRKNSTTNPGSSFEDCEELCPSIRDGSACPPMGKSQTPMVNGKCPKGSVPRPSLFLECCNSTLLETWYRESGEPECGNGKTPVTIESKDGIKPLLGMKECRDNFCPNGSVCTSGTFLAWCCLA